MKLDQAYIEQHIGWMIVLIVLVVSVGGLVEIVPLYFQKSTTEAVAGVSPYTPLQLTGRDVYLREGCYNCHSQMVRPFRAETERYGHYSVAGEFVYDHPFQWGSKRTGPDLARVGGRYSDTWHRTHLTNPRDVVPNRRAGVSVARQRRRRRRHRISARARHFGLPYFGVNIARRRPTQGPAEEDTLVTSCEPRARDEECEVTDRTSTPSSASRRPCSPCPAPRDRGVGVRQGTPPGIRRSGERTVRAGGRR